MTVTPAIGLSSRVTRPVTGIRSGAELAAAEPQPEARRSSPKRRERMRKTPDKTGSVGRGGRERRSGTPAGRTFLLADRSGLELAEGFAVGDVGEVPAGGGVHLLAEEPDRPVRPDRLAAAKVRASREIEASVLPLDPSPRVRRRVPPAADDVVDAAGVAEDHAVAGVLTAAPDVAVAVPHFAGRLDDHG